MVCLRLRKRPYCSAKRAVLQCDMAFMALQNGPVSNWRNVVLIFGGAGSSEEAAAIERGLAHGVARAAQAGAVVPVGFEREEAVGVGH